MNLSEIIVNQPRCSWDEYFMQIALLTSTRSKDCTKVGAVIIRDRTILSTGYNGFPRGIDDTIPERHNRPEKYKWTCHAEENAILNAARIGSKISGSDIFVTMCPCSNCAKSIIQSEIRRVVSLKVDNPRWIDDFKFTEEMFSEVGIKLDYIEI